ncbi:MAG: glutamyl-tRNA reductase [Candidatus Zixiibacteriota bacterium]|nr:MAG: glutamyl-tRNA reductase [candidate division Zixibacteria bacterium]
MAAGQWYLSVCGVNHTSTTVEQRAPLQLSRDDIAEAHSRFSRLTGVKESTIVATCNRIEFYAVIDRPYDIFEHVAAFYAESRDLDISGLREQFYIRKNKHAVDHLFRVSAGIDSMILGENQILGQIKEAYSSACRVKAAGKIIHRLFHQGFRVGKLVRTDTEMGRGACSVSSASMEFLQPKIERLKNPAVLFIGVSKMISLAAESLHQLEKVHFTFANRTLEKARQLAVKYGADAYPLSELPALLARADVVITCTGATEPIVSSKQLQLLAREMPEKRLIIIDMAVPRDFELEKRSLANIELYDLEDIGQYVRERQKLREQAIPRAEEIIERKLSEFMYWFDHVRHEPLYNGLAELFEEIRRRELSSLEGKLEPELQEKLDTATRRMVDKLLQVKIRTSSNPE